MTLNTSVNRISAIHAHQEVVFDHPKAKKTSNMGGARRRLAESLSNLLHLNIEPPLRRNLQQSNWDLFDEEKHNTPTSSPKELIADKWRASWFYGLERSFRPSSPLATARNC